MFYSHLHSVFQRGIGPDHPESLPSFDWTSAQLSWQYSNTSLSFFFFIRTLCAWNSSAHTVKQWNSPCVVLQSNPPTKSFLSRVDAMPLSQTLCKTTHFFFKASLQSYDITKDTATTVGRCCQSKRPQKTKGTSVFGGEDWTQCQSQQRSSWLNS